jgi:hypothetical protein
VKKLAVFMALLASLSVFAAERKFEQGDNYAVLEDNKCQLELFKNFSRFDELKAARVHLEGKDYKACYLEERGLVIIVDEDGDQYGPFDSKVFN